LTVCHWMESVQPCEYQAEPMVRINQRNNWTHHSLLNFSTFILYKKSHCSNSLFQACIMTRRLTYSVSEQNCSTGLKPSRQCSCRLYHTEIYIVCQVHDSTIEFILRFANLMQFGMSAHSTLIICQPSATQKHLHKDNPL